MTWIRTVAYEESEEPLKSIYDRIKGPSHDVDNIMKAHSLRPHTMKGHLSIYKSVLHHSANELPVWFLETLGLFVSLTNRCDYCIAHHYKGIQRLVGDERAQLLRRALESGDYQEVFTPKETAGIRYADQLTKHPEEVVETDIKALQKSGFDDGEILEVNQVVSYFAYANRVVLGLGVTIKGDVLGRSPSAQSPDDWSHH